MEFIQLIIKEDTDSYLEYALILFLYSLVLDVATMSVS